MIETANYVRLDDFGRIIELAGRFRVGDFRNKRRNRFLVKRR